MVVEFALLQPTLLPLKDRSMSTKCVTFLLFTRAHISHSLFLPLPSPTCHGRDIVLLNLVLPFLTFESQKKMLSILMKPRLKDKEMRVLML
jgi:hypothetical protein